MSETPVNEPAEEQVDSPETQAPIAYIGQLELVNAAGPRAAQVEAMLDRHGIVVVYPADMPKEDPENPVEPPVEEKPENPIESQPENPIEPPAAEPAPEGNAGGEATPPSGSDSIEGGGGADGVV